MFCERIQQSAIFHVHYERIARVIARVAGDPARAEELAIEIFWKLWRQAAEWRPDAGDRPTHLVRAKPGERKQAKVHLDCGQAQYSSVTG
jgi:sigma-70-like protein